MENPAPYSAKELNYLHNEISEREFEILGYKGAEYSSDQDRLINFFQVGVMTNQTPEKVIFSYLCKHIQCIGQAIETNKYDWCWTTKEGTEGLKQRIVDVRNYAILLAGLLDAKEKLKLEEESK